ALAAFDTALAIAPDHMPSLLNRGHMLFRLKRYEKALAAYRAMLTAQPEHSEALGQAVHTAALICNWPAISELSHRLRASVDSRSFAGDRFAILSMFDDPLLQRKAAEDRSAKVGSRAPARANVASSNRRLRVGYLSADFKMHAVAYLIS